MPVKVQRGRTTEDYRKKQNIYVQGDLAKSTFFIQKGSVKITVTSERGKEAVIGILQEGDFFGEGGHQLRRWRSATATALGSCRISSFTDAAMASAISDEPNFSKLFLDHLLRKNSRIQEDILDQRFNFSEKRLARLLLVLSNYGKEGDLPIVPIFLSQETLAGIIGTTRSRVSFFMNKFRNLGLVDYNGAIHVHSSLSTRYKLR